MDPVGLGFIGYGIMGERLLRAALDHDPAVLTVAGVWDPSPEAMVRLCRDLPSVRPASSARELIERSDCVYVASPPSSHLGHARDALRHGRAVFCEKPLAVDLDDAREFVRDAEASAARVAVNFPFASSFAVDRLRAWMADGMVGRPRSLTIEVAFATWPRGWQAGAASWLARPEEGGFTREVISHFLFLSRRVLGSLTLQESAVAFPNRGASEERVEATLAGADIPIHLIGRVGATDKDDHNLWTLEGQSGAIRLRDWSVAERLGDGVWVEAPDALPNERIRPLVLKRQLDKVAAMTQGATHDLATVREALDVQEIVEAILGARLDAARQAALRPEAHP